MRQPFVCSSAALRILGIGGFLAVVAFGIGAAFADGRDEKDVLPPLTIKFVPGPSNLADTSKEGPKCSYITTDKLQEPWSHSNGAFICDKEGGTAAYHEGGKPFYCTLKWSKMHTSEQGIDYYMYEEPKVGDQQKIWALEAKRNKNGNWTIYCRVNDGPFTFFQLADQVTPER